jgi:hypothetical protein
MATTAPVGSVPPWARWLTLIVTLGLLVLSIAAAESPLGSWMAPVGCLIAVTFLAAIVIRTDFRAHRLLRDRIESRPAVPVITQARSLLEARGITASRDSIERVASRWLEVGRFLRLRPEHLRASDNLARDYQDAPTLGMWRAIRAGGSEWERAESRPAYGCDVAPPKCLHCGYDRTGIPESAACPECGTVPVIIRTLGDYLLLASGLSAHPPGNSSPSDSPPSSGSP